MVKVLIVDDCKTNMELLHEHLKMGDYEIVSAYDGESGWELLQQNKDVAFILLDRMMPRLDGIAFMERLGESDIKVPVIMQTALSDHQSIVEGIDSGVFYYLTKPFTHEMLMSIINAALNDHRYKSKLLDVIDKNKMSMSLITNLELKYRTMDEVPPVANILVSIFPDSQKAAVGVSELLYNAVEHGNLNIGFTKKSELLNDGGYEEEIKKRLDLPENKDKYVVVNIYKDANEVVLTIKDCGEGFYFKDFFELKPERAMMPNGRGLIMTRLLSFEDLHYTEDGTKVECRQKIK